MLIITDPKASGHNNHYINNIKRLRRTMDSTCTRRQGFILYNCCTHTPTHMFILTCTYVELQTGLTLTTCNLKKNFVFSSGKWQQNLVCSRAYTKNTIYESVIGWRHFQFLLTNFYKTNKLCYNFKQFTGVGARFLRC